MRRKKKACWNKEIKRKKNRMKEKYARLNKNEKKKKGKLKKKN